jgi:hypothetical protein
MRPRAAAGFTISFLKTKLLVFLLLVFFPHTTMSSTAAIKLNNDAVTELKRGNLREAFAFLCHASDRTTQSYKYAVHTSGSYYCRYQWENCTSALVSSPHLMPLQAMHGEGTSFLHLRFLKISTPVIMEGQEIECFCPCGFAWVVHFK